jgi:hypothetical protein
MHEFCLRGRRAPVAGHHDMFGSDYMRPLEHEGCEVLTAGRDRLHLAFQAQVDTWMDEARPEVVVVAGGKVGRILENDTCPTVARVTGYRGRIVSATTKPGGATRKRMDVGRIAAMGWVSCISLEEGLAETCRWFLAQQIARA